MIIYVKLASFTFPLFLAASKSLDSSPTRHDRAPPNYWRFWFRSSSCYWPFIGWVHTLLFPAFYCLRSWTVQLHLHRTELAARGLSRYCLARTVCFIDSRIHLLWRWSCRAVLSGFSGCLSWRRSSRRIWESLDQILFLVRMVPVEFSCHDAASSCLERLLRLASNVTFWESSWLSLL